MQSIQSIQWICWFCCIAIGKKKDAAVESAISTDFIIFGIFRPSANVGQQLTAGNGTAPQTQGNNTSGIRGHRESERESERERS